ncbi:MAG TPA: hypothetical protein VKP69_21540, partial [Isosphaeraceae bacterium]|nr:hypothetical protein [Isosphaeraceae bacterium]
MAAVRPDCRARGADHAPGARPAPRTRPRLLVVLAAVCGLGAGPPEVVRVQVPAEKVGQWFPAGAAIRGLSSREFEALVEGARAAAERPAPPAVSRLLRARHSARWEDGVLSGRSELVVDAPGPSELELAPWTPAIVIPAGAPSPLRARESGRTAVRVEPSGPSTIALDWQLRARPSSKGRGFTLGLPQTEGSRLTLDLPDGWVPEGPAGVRQGPGPGPAPGRSLWTFDGRGGLTDLRLRAPDAGQGRDAGPEARVAIEGPTRIDLTEAAANWRTDWTVAVDPRGPHTFRFELDAGLELIDVTGPDVDEFQAEATGSGARVTVALDDDATGATPVLIRALARVPAEGPWSVPAVRPLDALWMGGTTTVRLDPGRVLEDCRERASRRASARPGGAFDARLLVFEATAPKSVAELIFRAPRADVSVEVRGQLMLGNAAPRLVCQVDWRAHRGRLLALDIDLPAAWVPDRIQVEGTDETIAWH